MRKRAAATGIRTAIINAIITADTGDIVNPATRTAMVIAKGVVTIVTDVAMVTNIITTAVVITATTTDIIIGTTTDITTQLMSLARCIL